MMSQRVSTAGAYDAMKLTQNIQSTPVHVSNMCHGPTYQSRPKNAIYSTLCGFIFESVRFSGATSAMMSQRVSTAGAYDAMISITFATSPTCAAVPRRARI